MALFFPLFRPQLQGTVEIWKRQLQYYEEWALVLLNIDSQRKQVSFKFNQLGLSYQDGYEGRDVLAHKDLGHFYLTTVYNFTVPATGALMMYLHAF